MAKGYEVLNYLIPDGGWYISGDDFAGIQFLECTPITKAAFEAGFAKVDALQVKETAKTQSDKAALLVKLGITADEAALLLS